MKLRCIHNSIRIRVTKSDLQELDQAGIITETLAFGGSTLFAFALSVDLMEERVNADYLENLVVVKLPLDIAQKWINSNEVGIEVTNELDNGASLHILIEKDFPCVDRANENKADTFFELATKPSDIC